MFNSNVLEVGVGLIFTFLAVSLITGAIIEAITSIIGWRANTLKNGIKALLNDPGFNGLARDLYAHASVNPRGPGTTAAETQAALGTGLLGFWTNKKPSYIDGEQFANALMDITGMSSAIANNPPSPPAVVSQTSSRRSRLRSTEKSRSRQFRSHLQLRPRPPLIQQLIRKYQNCCRALLIERLVIRSK